MGGIAKGLLPTPSGEPIVHRLVRLAQDLGLEPVLVGDHPAYRAALPHLAVIPDRPGGIGPLGGLIPLLERHPSAIAIACDLPFVTGELIARLVTTAPGAVIVAPRSHHPREQHLPANPKWNPLFARYLAAATLPSLQAAAAAGKHGMQPILDALATELPLAPHELQALHDWDAPEDR